MNGDSYKGQKIKIIREMTDEEQKREGWDTKATVIELENGATLYASRDPEGNGPGALFGITEDEKAVSF